MNQSSRNRAQRELDELLTQLCESGLSETQMKRFEELALSNSDAGRRVAEYLQLDGYLRCNLGAGLESELSMDTLPELPGPQVLSDPLDTELVPAAVARSQYISAASLATNSAETVELEGRSQAIVARAFARPRLWAGGILAAMLAIVVAVPLYRSLIEQRVVELPAARVAMIVASTDALWGGDMVPDAEGWLPAGRVQLRRGQVEIRFAYGAVVVLKAPAEFQAISPTEARLFHGSMAAMVDATKTSFRVDTPTADVIDLGTEFGLSVARSGETDVAVFNGMVDVSPLTKSGNVSGQSPASAVGKPQRRLMAGEALRVNWQGQFRRIATVTDDSFPPLNRTPPTEDKQVPLIAAVSDTLRDEDENPKFYRVVRGGFGEDCAAFVDRNYEWNGIDQGGLPEFLLGADYIMPFNDDKDKDLNITITLARPAAVLVLFDDRGVPPAWLEESFVDTGLDVGMDEDAGLPAGRPTRKYRIGRGPGESVEFVFSVWRRDVEQPGEVVLGPRGPQKGGRTMYGIVAVPLDK